MNRYLVILTSLILVTYSAKAQVINPENLTDNLEFIDSIKATQVLQTRYGEMNRVENVVNTMAPPQAKIFERYYLDHPVAEYSGLPQIEIPLYTIDFDGIKIPITLSYHAGGIKYQQYDGDVGVGWSIQASGGYRVNRDAYGKPDENSKLFNPDDYDRLRADASLGGDYQIAFDGYLALTALHEYQMERLLRNGYTDVAINSKKHEQQDSEYDRFTYMLPSTSGHFVIQDRVKDNVYIMEQHADKVKLHVKNKGSLGNNDLIIGLEITDESGFIHSFGSETDE